MTKTQTTLLIILLLLGVCPCNAIGSAIVKIGKILYNVLEFGLTIWGVFDAFDEPQSDSASFEQLLGEISTMIESTEKRIIHTITIQGRMSNVDDAVKNIKSSLKDLNEVVRANDSATRQEYLDLFCKRFDDQGVIKHVRFLPELLEYTSAGTSPALIDLIADQHRCNMTALYDFMMFYYNLESSGIALEKLYLKYRLPSLLESTETQRYMDIVAINTTFEKIEAFCKGRLLNLAQEDMTASTNARKLLEENNQRYPWVTSDVFFLYPYSTHQFLYMKYLDGSVIWKRTPTNKVVVFADRDDVQYKNVSFSNQGAENILKKSIGGKDDKSAAKNVGEAVENLLDAQGFCLVTLLVFFDGGEFASRAIELDNDSPVVFTALHHIDLEYCSKPDLCITDPTKVLGYFKTVRGQMKIAVYVKEKAVCSELTLEYKISDAFSIHTSFLTYVLMLVSLIAC